MEERLSWGDDPRQAKLQSSKSGSGSVNIRSDFLKKLQLILQLYPLPLLQNLAKDL